MANHSDAITPGWRTRWRREGKMKIAICGGGGLVGSEVSRRLRDQGHDVAEVSADSEVNMVTGYGLADAIHGAEVVVDVSNSPSFQQTAMLRFFPRTLALLDAETAAGVAHHVAVSVVGTERLSAVGFFRTKIAEERLLMSSLIPYSVVHATQCFQLVQHIADVISVGSAVRVPPVLVQPMAAEDIGAEVAAIAIAAPLNGAIEVAGPEVLRLDEFVRRYLLARGDARQVVADPRVRYFGALLEEGTLLPSAGARLSRTTFAEWLGRLA
jgi:uncharacterized protein YbjT (DUF2867 family)